MRLLRALLLIATTALAGCGGGGSGSGSGGVSPGEGSSSNGKTGVAAGDFASCGGDATSSVNIGVATSDAFTISSTSITFTGVQGTSAPNSQLVDVAWTSANVFIRTLQTGTMFGHTFTARTSTTGQIRVAPAMPTQPGPFTGTITVNACSNATGPCNDIAGSPKTIDVAYNVAGLSITPRQLTFSYGGNSPPQRQSAALSITGGSPFWTSQVSYSGSAANWLGIRTDSGTQNALSQTLFFNVGTYGLGPGVHSATVTLSTPPSFITPMPVTFLVGPASVNFVSPYVVPAGLGGYVMIRGLGFSALSPGSLLVQFNSTPAVAAVVTSDTEIQALYPALAAGSYAVSVSSGGTSIPSRAAVKLVVIDPPAFAPTTIQRPASAGRPSNLIYDAERQALLFVDAANKRILRYALSDNGSTTLENAGSAIALSPDGTELIQTGLGLRLTRLDPVSLAVLSSTPSGFTWLGSIAFANDGGAIGNGFSSDGFIYRYDMLTQAITPVSFQSDMLYRQIFASADGQRLVLSNYWGNPIDKRVYTYDAATGALAPRPATTSGSNALGMSGSGSRMIVVNDCSPTPITIYDAEFNALGTLPNGAGTFVLAPGGNLAYAYYPSQGRVRKFSIGPTGGVSEIGSGSVVAPANTEMSEMTITPDGGTLFLVGTTSVVIAPSP